MTQNQVSVPSIIQRGLQSAGGSCFRFFTLLKRFMIVASEVVMTPVIALRVRVGSETRTCEDLQESAAGRQNRSSVENLGLRTEILVFFRLSSVLSYSIYIYYNAWPPKNSAQKQPCYRVTCNGAFMSKRTSKTSQPQVSRTGNGDRNTSGSDVSFSVLSSLIHSF